MAILVGIDEAGYGPTLGPLVVSACAFRVREAETDLWSAMPETVCRCAGAGDQRVVIDDSKRVYTPARGLGRLETSVLACLGEDVDVPTTFGRLLRALAFQGFDELCRYPWYDPMAATVPVAASAERIRSQAQRWGRGLERAGVAFIGAKSLPTFPAEFNRLVDRTGNKSTVLYALTGQLMAEVWRQSAGEHVRVVLDKQGGRSHYLPLLSGTFPGQAILRRGETAESSLYEVRRADQRMTVEFRMRADATELPVALASMVSKYVRELSMGQFNAFWQGQVADLKPTAGYPQDAKRFLAAIRERQQQLGLDSGLFVRKR